MKKFSFSKGFTIVELIIVIAIISILAGIVLSSIAGYINRAKDETAKSNVGQIVKSLQVYYSENGNFVNYTLPTTLNSSKYGANVNPNYYEFVAFGKLGSGGFWAQDSTGASRK